MSLKKNIVCKLADLLDNKDLASYNLVLATSGGTITGHLLTEEDLEDEENVGTSLASLCSSESLSYKESLNLSESDSLPDNEGYLILKDVKILRTQGTITLPIMIVFFDEIIGVSLGKFD